MACAANYNARTGQITVTGDDAREVQTVVLSVARHLQDFARQHPSILEPPPLPEVQYGDRIQVLGNVGTLGHGNEVHIDMRALALDLDELKSALLAVASTSQDYEDVAALTEARLAVDAKDQSRLFAALKNLGRRTLDVAQEIGTSVASSVITRAIGL